MSDKTLFDVLSHIPDPERVDYPPYTLVHESLMACVEALLTHTPIDQDIPGAMLATPLAMMRVCAKFIAIEAGLLGEMIDDEVHLESLEFGHGGFREN